MKLHVCRRVFRGLDMLKQPQEGRAHTRAPSNSFPGGPGPGGAPRAMWLVSIRNKDLGGSFTSTEHICAPLTLLSSVSIPLLLFNFAVQRFEEWWEVTGLSNALRMRFSCRPELGLPHLSNPLWFYLKQKKRKRDRESKQEATSRQSEQHL